MLAIVDCQPISYNPGISGFCKAHRHPSGAALVMSRWDDEGRGWVAIYWVKRLVHNAIPIQGNCFPIAAERAANRLYNLLLSAGPPHAAISDYQRQRVYDWEEQNIFPGHQSITWDECRAFLHEVWDKVGRGPAPKLINHLRTQTATSFCGTIHLPPDQYYCKRPIILHEIAHELKFYDKHGPEFVSMYIDLCSRFLGLEHKNLINSAVRCGVLYR